MNIQEFDDILEERIYQIKSVLKSKAKEYATEDRLHNFKVAAKMNGSTNARALWGMASKHLVSVMDMLDSEQKHTADHVNEKVGDLINYLILLEAVFKEPK